MGDMADYYFDSMCKNLMNVDYDDDIESTPILSNESIWTTREGKRIKIKDMENAHLLNSIRMINRDTSTELDHVFTVLCNEATRRKLNVPLRNKIK